MNPTKTEDSILNISLLLQGYNFNRSTVSIALDLIFVSTGFRIPAPKITFKDPVVMDLRPDIDDDANTYVNTVVDRNFDRRIGGNTGFLYRRIPLELLAPTVPDTKINPIQIPFTTSSILSQINKVLKTQLTMNDLIEFTYGGQSDEVLLIANPKSLTWVGEITLGVNSGYIPPLVSLNDLNGFSVYNNPIQA